MTSQKLGLSTLAVAVAAAQSLPAQYAYAQDPASQGTRQQTSQEKYCRTQVPKDVLSISALTVHNSACVRAWNETKKADIAWYTAWSQIRLAYHYYNNQKQFNSDYIGDSAFLGTIAKNAGYDVKALWESGSRIEQLKKEYNQKYGEPKSSIGIDNSAEAKCLYTAPKAASGPEFDSWFTYCGAAYNAHPNPWLADLYAVGSYVKSVNAYQSNDLSEGQKYLGKAKEFITYADSMGWATASTKSSIPRLEQFAAQRQVMASQEQQRQRQLAQQQQQERQRQLAQQQSQKSNSGLSDGEKAGLLIGGAALLYLLFGGNSKGSSGSSSSSSAYDRYSESERQRRQQQDVEDNMRRQREREANREQQSQPQQRSYGFYGDCPAPGMGYGC